VLLKSMLLAGTPSCPTELPKCPKIAEISLSTAKPLETPTLCIHYTARIRPHSKAPSTPSSPGAVHAGMAATEPWACPTHSPQHHKHGSDGHSTHAHSTHTGHLCSRPTLPQSCRGPYLLDRLPPGTQSSRFAGSRATSCLRLPAARSPRVDLCGLHTAHSMHRQYH
jgi:hypothetical protein